jgi:Baseplate J-like protein
MSCSGTSDCLCGCCSGISVQTPQLETNLPGLPAITYRAGTWATFKASMLARLSSTEYPALAGLKTRDDDDFTIALLDAASVLLDILTFYQERLANESFLRTATQLQSLTELVRLIGYQPAPGVAASTYLSFTLAAPTGLPADPAMQAITIPKGTQVLSAPAQDQAPQTFETSTDILAKSDWNALPVQTGIPWLPPGSNYLYLSGTGTQLQAGDSLLLLGAGRENWSPGGTAPDQDWDVVIVNKVKTDTLRNLTYVEWDTTLTHAPSGAAGPVKWTTAKVFALRQKAALFGNSAPDPNLFTRSNNPLQTSLPKLIKISLIHPWQWYNFFLLDSDHIDLNSTYPKLVGGSWFALTKQGSAQLYKVKQSQSVSLAKFGLSAKVTRLSSDFADPKIRDFDLQPTEVWAQSEELELTEQPLTHPLYGSLLDLEGVRTDLAGVKAVAIHGKSQKLRVNTGAAAMHFLPDDGSDKLTLKPEDVVTFLEPLHLPLDSNGFIPNWASSFAFRKLRVLDSNGRTGTLKARLSDFTLVPASKDDPVIQEFGRVSSVSNVTDPYPHTRIHLASELLNCYDRTATTVNANVGLATQGMSVTEILGSGSAPTPNQQFSLKQYPLTFVQAPTPTGRESTLQVNVNSVRWTEVPGLYQQSPSSRVFATLNQPGGRTDILFGDGAEGAMLPTGQNNVQANYRVGSGLSGNVAAGSITTLMDRPLGVIGVNNPQAATGGQDAQSVDDIRASASLSVLTLGRAVSITDYQNYASSFAGIAKAYAIWITTGPGRGVFLTVAGAGGSALPPGNPTLNNLITSLHNFGNPLIPINVASFLETLFGLRADLKYDPAYALASVKAAVLDTLRQTYTFAARSFGQGVSSDELAALIQGVPGVVAVNVTNLKVCATSRAGDLSAGAWSVAAYNTWLSQQVLLPRPYSDTPTRICPYLPIANPSELPLPAEILVLDPDPKSVVLGTLP